MLMGFDYIRYCYYDYIYAVLDRYKNVDVNKNIDINIHVKSYVVRVYI